MRPLVWAVAVVLVAACWLAGSLADTSHLAYGQTVPAVDQVSQSAASVLKRRPQLAADPTSPGRVYMVWEEGTGDPATASGVNSTNLMYSWRDPGTGTWSAPGIVFGTNPDAARWTGATGVGEMYPHIQVDGNGDLHVVFSAERAGTIGRSVYYTVGSGLTGAPSWTTPLRLDYVTFPGTAGNLLNRDNTRLFVRPNPDFPVTPYPMVAYVLWTGNSGNQLKLSRVGYGPGTTVTRIDNTPLSNPVTANAGPVAVLEIDATTLQAVYVVKNSSGSGNGFFGAPLTLAGSTISWGGPPTALTGASADDCSISGCTGATAVRDTAAGATWIATNYDLDLPRRLQTTVHNGSAATIFVHDAAAPPKMARQPVIVNDAATGPVMIYTQCALATGSTSACSTAEPLRNTYYRVYSYTDGAWGAPALANAVTAGDQKDLTAVMVGGDLYYAWVGTKQDSPTSGDQAYFSIVPAPVYTP